MRKIAFFVEGFSEMLFVERLISEVAEVHSVLIHKMKIRGGGRSGKVPRAMTEVEAARKGTDEKFYVLIVDCGGDVLVGQRIKEEHGNLTAAGYEKIVGVRDVRPDFTREELPKLERGMKLYLKTSLAPVVFVLSTMEVEAWFLAEYNHFAKIHPSITPETIHSSLGFDPRNFDTSLRDRPADDLLASYQLAGIEYIKAEVKDTIDCLDFAFIYSELTGQIPALGLLSNTIDEFLTV